MTFHKKNIFSKNIINWKLDDYKDFFKIKIIIIFSIVFLFFFAGKVFSYDFNITDSIAPFFDENKKIEHYSNLPYYQLDLENWKVDTKQLDESIIRFENYIKILKEKWYSHIMFDNLQHLILLEDLWIYKNSDIEKRNKIYRKYFKKIIEICKKNQIWIFITSDMQFYDKFIEKYVWKIDSKNKKLKEINKSALKDLFESFAYVDWLIIRIWEWWWAYDNSFYKSKIIYDTPKKVNNFLNEIIPIFEKYDKKLIFRTWTIWIWKIWDLIVNKKTYDKTFSWINSDNLIVSIKYTPGDYFWFEELNPTIWDWSLKQIVEFEIRREYEWWWDIPNFVKNDYEKLKTDLQGFKNIYWLWYRNQSWWWWYWKNIIFNFWFTFWNEINFLNINLDKRNDEIFFWEYGNKLNNEEKKVIKDILNNSRELIKKWLYFDSYRKKELYFLKIRLPSLNRIWWDRPVSSPLILSIIYNNIDRNYEIENAKQAYIESQNELDDFKKVMNKDSQLSKEIMYSLENRKKIFEILYFYKKDIISYFDWNWKKNNDIVLDKISKYEDFISDKKYLNFDFREIKNFYKEKDLFFERDIFLIIWKLYNLNNSVNILNIIIIIIAIDFLSIFRLIKIKKFKYRYIFFSFSFIILYFVVFLLIYMLNINHNLIPTYFNEAWSDLEDFLK